MHVDSHNLYKSSFLAALSDQGSDTNLDAIGAVLYFCLVLCSPEHIKLVHEEAVKNLEFLPFNLTRSLEMSITAKAVRWSHSHIKR